MEVIYTPLPTLYSPLNGASIVICPFSKFTTRQSEDLKPRRIWRNGKKEPIESSNCVKFTIKYQVSREYIQTE